MKQKELKVETSDFKTIITDNGYFVDKTMLIKEFLDNSHYILLMPRPKRFGKTLNLSMIEHFFDIRKPESKELFKEFEISKHEEFCELHQNKYPVINLTLKDIKEENWNSCFESLKTLIAQLYKEHNYLLQSDKLSDNEKELINDIIVEKAKDKFLKYGLEFLSQYLQKHFNKDVIILVDEYDTPIINAFKNTSSPIRSERGSKTYYEKVIDFLQGFLGKAYKGNGALKKGFLTGVMRVGKESIFSDWNNFHVYGITSAYFSDKFGFTEQETLQILKYFGLKSHINAVKKWYNGYKFGKIEGIYNPWSIVNYIASNEDGFKPYWVNTSDDSLIKERITEPNIKEAIIELINNKTIIRTIEENFVFPDFECDMELIWTLMFNSGFLTQVKEISLYRYEFKIPNYELSYVSKKLILEWIRTTYKFNRDLLISSSNHLINNRIAEFETGFKQIMGDTLSYTKTKKTSKKE